MKNLSSLFSRAALTIAGALALGACNRAEYAMLPQSASYLGTKSAAVAPRPAAPVATASQVATPSATPVAAAPEANLATVPVSADPVAVTSAAQPVASAPVAQAAPVQVAPAEASLAPATPAKLNLVQRLALKKITHKLDKLASKAPQFKSGDNTAHTARINGNLRTGLILLLIGLIVGLFNGLIGTIIALIGVVFIVLWLLDEL